MAVKSIPDRPLEDLRAIAQGLAAGAIFCDRHVRTPDMYPAVFGPLAFGVDIPDNVGMIYEHMDKAGPRSINGMPFFMSMKWINAGDTEKVMSMYNKLREAAAKVEP